jgi:hypothetical protein
MDIMEMKEKKYKGNSSNKSKERKNFYPTVEKGSNLMYHDVENREMMVKKLAKVFQNPPYVKRQSKIPPEPYYQRDYKDESSDSREHHNRRSRDHIKNGESKDNEYAITFGGNQQEYKMMRIKANAQ